MSPEESTYSPWVRRRSRATKQAKITVSGDIRAHGFGVTWARLNPEAAVLANTASEKSDPGSFWAQTPAACWFPADMAGGGEPETWRAE